MSRLIPLTDVYLYIFLTSVAPPCPSSAVALLQNAALTSLLHLRQLRVSTADTLASGARGMLMEDRLVLLECDSTAPTGILPTLGDQNL